MRLKSFFSTVTFLLASSYFCFAQADGRIKTASISPNAAVKNIKSSPAYAEILLRKTERTAELEELLLDYTEEFPKVKELRFESGLLQKEMDKLLAVSASEAGKLTLALGKLLVRKIELEVDLWNLKIQYNDDQADVKRAKRKIEVYEKAVKEILP